MKSLVSKSSLIVVNFIIILPLFLFLLFTNQSKEIDKLVENQDLELMTKKDYIVGSIVKAIVTNSKNINKES